MTKNKKKNKHIYSDSKKNGLTIAVTSTTNTLHNPMKEIEELYKLPIDDWTDYISSIMYDKKPLRREDVWEDTSYILNEINNSGINKHILTKMIYSEDELFNPFVDIFPLYLFDDGTKNLIIKKQKFLKEYGKYKNPFIYNGFNIMVLYNDNRISFKEYHKFFDVVIAFNSYSVIISISKETKEYFDLKPLLEQFNEIEPNRWQLNKNKTMLYVVNNQKTKIRIYENKDLLEECLSIITSQEADDFIIERNEKYIQNFVSNI